MKNQVIECIDKQLNTALRQQQGNRSRYLNCISDMQEVTRSIKKIMSLQESAVVRLNRHEPDLIDINLKCIRHGINPLAQKSFTDVWNQDIAGKSIQIREARYNQNRANWSEGEIAMLNAVSERINAKDPARPCPYVILHRHYDDARPSEWVYPNEYDTWSLPEDQVRAMEYDYWSCDLPALDPARYRT